MRRALEAAASLSLAVVILGAALLPLLTPPFTAELSSRYSEADKAGLSDDEMLTLAEQVRAFVVEREGVLPNTVHGRAAFDAAAVSHLEDVAAVMAGARWATGLAFVVFIGIVIWWIRKREFLPVSHSFIGGGAGVVTAAVIAGLVGQANFDAFFAWFHSLFFSAGTWTFPYDSLLIQLFPEGFWIAGGIAWAVLCAVFAGASVAAGLALRHRIQIPAE